MNFDLHLNLAQWISSKFSTQLWVTWRNFPLIILTQFFTNIYFESCLWFDMCAGSYLISGIWLLLYIWLSICHFSAHIVWAIPDALPSGPALVYLLLEYQLYQIVTFTQLLLGIAGIFYYLGTEEQFHKIAFYFVQ